MNDTKGVTYCFCVCVPASVFCSLLYFFTPHLNIAVQTLRCGLLFLMFRGLSACACVGLLVAFVSFYKMTGPTEPIGVPFWVLTRVGPWNHACLQCFDAVGWAAGRASGLYKTEWWGASVVICLERGADLHMAQLMPLPLTVSCFSKIQIGVTFLVPAYPGSSGQRAVKRVCVGGP